MYEILTATNNLPAGAIGWLVLLFSVLVVIVWTLYLYR